MAITNKKALLETLAGPDTSRWAERAAWREENQAWLNRSQEIALKVLHTLRQKGMSQRDLAGLLDCSAQHVSKLVSGKENLTLETISRLEDLLGIRLISVPSFSMTMEVKMNAQLYYAAEGHLVKQAETVKTTQPLSSLGAYYPDEELEVA